MVTIGNLAYLGCLKNGNGDSELGKKKHHFSSSNVKLLGVALKKMHTFMEDHPS